MNEISSGAVGSVPSLTLRVGQAVFSTTSLLFMSVGVEFYSYTSFCFLVTSMGLLIPWSCFLAVVDVYSFFLGCPFRLPGAIILIAAGDWLLSLLALASACATGGVVTLLLQSDGYCSPGVCGRYQLSALMAFLSWALTAASSLFNLWSLSSSWRFL
ncbi:hypothetical protein LUZ60_004996 [Juncus effusus]|nr:hypothetical protein LUZ60_004996 [Juncus effusus]